MGNTDCKYNWHKTGRQVFYDNSTFETLLALYPVSFSDDFGGSDVVIPVAASPESGCKWINKIVGAGPPTVAKTADGVNGNVLCSFTSDSQKQDAEIYWDDQLVLSLAQGVIFETRLALTTLPTLLSVASFGLWGAWADGGSAFRVGFEVPAGGIVTCESDDDATDIPAATTTTLVAGTYYIFRIDCTDQADIKFYIDGVKVATSTTFANAASTADSKCQPFLGLYKASGAGLGIMSIDYVRAWQNRS